jgi:hypothetical protein
MCDCKKRPPVVINPKRVKVELLDEIEPTKEEISMVDDWYNNIDIIEPINDDEYPLIHD